MEWWALPRMAEEFSKWGTPQYWDEERRVSSEVKDRIVTDVQESVPWDMFILFGPDATWQDAEKHVIGWGRTVIGNRAKLCPKGLAHKRSLPLNLVYTEGRVLPCLFRRLSLV